MAVRNSNLPSLIDVAHDRPLVLSKPAYINGQLYQPGEVVGIYDAAGDQFFVPSGPVVSAREMRVLLGTVIHDPRHVVRMETARQAAVDQAELKANLLAMRESFSEVISAVEAKTGRRSFAWPRWLVWLFTRPAPLPVLAPRRTSVIARHGFGGAGARA